MSGTLDLLLQMEPPALPTAQVKIKRLSKLCGEDVVFDLKALPYSRVADIKKMGEQSDVDVQILLAGVASPDLKNKELATKYHAETPAELTKKLLLAGEIEDISRKIEHLSGYRETTLETIKKK